MGDRSRALWQRPVDEAWRELRQQLADHLAEFGEESLLLLEVQVGAEDHELEGAAPYVQFEAWGDGETLRSEVSSQHYLDDRFAIGEAGRALLEECGWHAPTFAPGEPADEGSPNWWADDLLREADLVAHRAVVALRDVFGVPHPAFLQVSGELELTGAATSGAVEGSADERAEAGAPDEEPLRFPRGSDELRAMVVEALEQVVAHPVELDDDGDVPMPVGRSVLYVQVLEDEPTLRLWARLVAGVVDVQRAADEAAILNRDLVFGTVVLTDSGCLDLHHHVSAMPFVPAQLRLTVARVLSDLDRRAGDLARRVGGRRWLDDEPAADGSGPTDLDAVLHGQSPSDDPADHELDLDGFDGSSGGLAAAGPSVSADLLVLRELLEADAADPRTVAALWDGDLRAMAIEIDGLRTDPPAVLDVADAIAALREAVVFVAERRSRQRWSRPHRPPGSRPRSQQQELLGAEELGEPVLDLGVDG